MELNVSLDFRCQGCGQPVGVTVRCRGPALARQECPEGPDAPARCAEALVPCPTCGQVNQLLFEPSGRVRSVRPMTCYRPLPAPSVN